MPESTIQKPKKPTAAFPLYSHRNGRWAKKIRGKTHYFGPWDDPNGALETYLDQKDELLAGRTPRLTKDGFTLHDLCNEFLTAKRHQQEAGDITKQTFDDYFKTCETMLRMLGKKRLVDDLGPLDFRTFRAKLAKTRNPNTLGNEIQRVRVAFNYAYNVDLIKHPVKFGPDFKRPAKRVLRALRQKKGRRMFEADELFDLIEGIDRPMRAMVLLGINCGFGNSDCGRLPMSAIKNGWIDFPRPKTAIERRCPLWPETIEAIEDALRHRPEPQLPEHADLVFVTKYGQPWAKETADNPITKEFRKLLDGFGLHRPGLGFYALRHTFETIAGGSRDQVAVNHIMGHADQSMAGVYREHIEDERLVDVTDHVWNWLFAE